MNSSRSTYAGPFPGPLLVDASRTVQEPHRNRPHASGAVSGAAPGAVAGDPLKPSRERPGHAHPDNMPAEEE
jgi:hypothetical protein